MGQRDARELGQGTNVEHGTFFLVPCPAKTGSLNKDRSSAATMLWTSELLPTWYCGAATVVPRSPAPWGSRASARHPHHGHDGTAVRQRVGALTLMRVDATQTRPALRILAPSST